MASYKILYFVFMYNILLSFCMRNILTQWVLKTGPGPWIIDQDSSWFPPCRDVPPLQRSRQGTPTVLWAQLLVTAKQQSSNVWSDNWPHSQHTTTSPTVQFPHAGSTTTFFWPPSSTVQVCQTRGLATSQHSTSAHHNCPGPGDPCAQFFKRGKWGCCQWRQGGGGGERDGSGVQQQQHHGEFKRTPHAL